MLVIGIAGGSGSGKTTVVSAIKERLHDEKVVVIPQDSYYKDTGDLTDEEKRHHNFDHPDAIDWELLCKQLAELKSGKTIHQPVYSYISCTRSKTETVTVRTMGWKEGFLPRIGILTPNGKDIIIKNGRKGNYLLLWFQRLHGIGRVIQKVGKQTA